MTKRDELRKAAASRATSPAQMKARKAAVKRREEDDALEEETRLRREAQADVTKYGGLKVKAIYPSFRRAGIVFYKDDYTYVPANSLTKEQYDLIMNEPALVVVEIDAKSAGDDAVERRPMRTGAATGAIGHAGTGETATPTMLKNAAEGKTAIHPSNIGAASPRVGVAAEEVTREDVRGADAPGAPAVDNETPDTKDKKTRGRA